MSGLVPITEIASEWVKKRFPTKALYFGISGEITFKKSRSIIRWYIDGADNNTD